MDAEGNPTTADPPSIVLDGVFFQFRDPSGIARVWASLLEEWSGTPFGQSLLVLDRDGAVPKFPGISYVPCNSFHIGLAATESFILEDLCRRHNAKIFISTFYTAPLETPSVVMVHDMIPEQFHDHEPKWLMEKRFSTYHASGYIAVSQQTAQDLHKHYPSTKDAPLRIARNGVSKSFHPVTPDLVQSFRKKYAVDKPYFLVVGRRHGHKNGQLFFNAFSRLADNRDVSIVCCGGREVLEREFRTCVEGNQVYMLRLDDEELNAAYTGALALVYPTKYEGFGLPIIEAMAAGCPVITCPNGSIPEVAGEAVLYVDDCDINGMLRALQSIQRREVREPLIQAGFQRATLFSWSNTAQIIGLFLTDMASRNYLLPEVGRPLSRKRWRELRTFERQYDTTSERLQEILRRPGMQRHMLPGPGHTTSESLLELESVWLKSIEEETTPRSNSMSNLSD